MAARAADFVHIFQAASALVKYTTTTAAVDSRMIKVNRLAVARLLFASRSDHRKPIEMLQFQSC